MECSAIDPARSSEFGISTSILPRSHGAFDVVDLTATSDTSGAGHGKEEGGFGFGHQQVRGDVERHIEGKAVCRFYENVFDASEPIKKADAAQAKEPVWTRRFGAVTVLYVLPMY